MPRPRIALTMRDVKIMKAISAVIKTVRIALTMRDVKKQKGGLWCCRVRVLP